MSLVSSLSKRLLRTGILPKDSLINELKQRGLISQISQPEHMLHEKLETGHKLKLYCGADPTARSLHLGNMVPLMVLLNFYVRGHDIVALVGGATGRVGDPSGRKTERDVMESNTRLDNIKHIQGQLGKFFETGAKYYEMKNLRTGVQEAFGRLTQENNYSWWKDIGMLDFLATYGRHIRIQSMLSRDSVSARLEGPEGLGFNEFTYQILQAYDFYHLYKEHSVTVQVGGNDQWGNITAGVDLINRLERNAHKPPPFGLTVPLLTTSTGEKFGKSAGNAVFIDPEINTAYDIFQFFHNTTDADVPKLLKIFTLLPLEEIEEVVNRHLKNPQLREGQRLLAREVTDLLHGPGSGKAAQTISDIIFDNGSVKQSLSADELIKLFGEARILKYGSKSESLLNILARLTNSSKSEAKRKLTQGSIYLHSSRIKATADVTDWEPYLIDSKVLILRIGKQKCFLVKME